MRDTLFSGPRDPQGGFLLARHGSMVELMPLSHHLIHVITEWTR